jgi:hypothetical protein
MSVDWNKPIQTRDGRKARVVCMDRKDYQSHRTYMCLVDNNGTEAVWFYKSNGYIRDDNKNDDLDIINVPEEHEIEIRFCKNSKGTICHVCMSLSSPCRECHDFKEIAKKKITIKEGEGL